jgi:hypothetical protein
MGEIVLQIQTLVAACGLSQIYLLINIITTAIVTDI